MILRHIREIGKKTVLELAGDTGIGVRTAGGCGRVQHRRLAAVPRTLVPVVAIFSDTEVL